MYLTGCDLSVHNIEYAADRSPVADPVLSVSPVARLCINWLLPEGDSETASRLENWAIGLIPEHGLLPNNSTPLN
jgi:hypothetical protein